MTKYKMPTEKSYVGDDLGSRVARYILNKRNNYKNMGNLEKAPKVGVTTGRNNPRGAKGAR
ncbi:MAG: hypothetical protein VW236_08190 [Flavobacteriaceae bacterium]